MDMDKKDFEAGITSVLNAIRALDQKVSCFIHVDSSGKMERLLDNQDLCMYLNVTPRTLQRYRAELLLPYLRLKKKPYYLQSDVNLFVERMKKTEAKI